MTKVIYNACHGGFGLSPLAQAALLSAGCTQEEVRGFSCENRHDPRLVHVVETMGSEAASGPCSELRAREISGTKYRVCRYEGLEHIETPESIYWVVIS